MIFGIFHSWRLAFDLSFILDALMEEKQVVIQDTDANSIKDYSHFKMS